MIRSNCLVENVYDPIASLILPQKHTHAHTPTPGTTQQHPTTLTLVWLLSLLLLLAASQRGTFLVPPSVYHTMADGSSPRYRRYFRNIYDFQLSRLSAECNATTVALAALGRVQRHHPAWTRVRRAGRTRCSRRTHEAQSFHWTFDCHTA